MFLHIFRYSIILALRRTEVEIEVHLGAEAELNDLDHVQHGSLQQLVIELGGAAQVVKSSRSCQRSKMSCGVQRCRRAVVSGNTGMLWCLRCRQDAVSGDADELWCLATPASGSVRRAAISVHCQFRSTWRE
jgi:hypothetical protein